MGNPFLRMASIMVEFVIAGFAISRLYYKIFAMMKKMDLDP